MLLSTWEMIKGYDSLGVSCLTHWGISYGEDSRTCGYYTDLFSIHMKKDLLYLHFAPMEAEWYFNEPEITKEYRNYNKETLCEIEGGLIFFNTLYGGISIPLIEWYLKYTGYDEAGDAVTERVHNDLYGNLYYNAGLRFSWGLFAPRRYDRAIRKAGKGNRPIYDPLFYIYYSYNPRFNTGRWYYTLYLLNTSTYSLRDIF